MNIRYLRPDDAPEDISNIYEQSWKYAYKGIIPQDYLDSIPHGRWVRSLEVPERKHFVCELDGKLIGTASICPSRWESHSGCGEIVSIYFLPGYIGKGFGKQLLERCVSEIRKDGFSKAVLWVLEENHTARRFYEKQGFVCTGEYREDSIGGKLLREVLYLFEMTCGEK